MNERMRRLRPALALAGLLTVSALPAGGAQSPWDPDDVMLEPHELAPGVYALLPADVDEKDHVGTTGGFVIGDDGVLVVESMVNGRLASQVIGEVRRKTTKPIRFLVNTSYHGDHSYGNFVFPSSTVVLHHQETKSYLDSKFEQDRKFMLGLMGEGKGIEEVVPRSADVTLADGVNVDLGGRRVELRHFGFGQTAGDVVVWLPEEKVLWVGNMIQAPPPALPWLLEGRHRDTIDTLEKVREFLPADARIVPGHGAVMSPDQIGFSIEYLEKLSRDVQDAIDQGWTVEQTVEGLDFSDYAGYSLFDWAHKQVNVPAVYKDLKK